MDYSWVSNYIGLPWEAYATGSSAYDCWGLVVQVSAEHFGRHCDRHIDTETNNSRAIHKTIKQEIASGNWKQVQAPKDGAVVLLSLSRKFHHIGIWLEVDGGMLLHSFEGSGVSLSSYSQLQDMGFRRIEFWHHVEILSEK